MIPMAISLGFGILFATTISLVIVPCLYLITEDVGKALRWLHVGGRRAIAMPEAEPVGQA